MERKLTAIVCADVHSYSRLMGEDEEATLVTLTAHRKIIDSLIVQHHGRFVNSAGDSVLAEFVSVVEAVNCAVDIQIALKAENAKLQPERRMEFRIGVNLGDVMVEGEQIYGDGINVAARLESLADPGGICISGMVHEQVRDKLALGYKDSGEQTVKNIARPVHVWRVLMDGGASPRPREPAGSTQVLAGWRIFVRGARDHRRHDRDRAASVVAAATDSRLDSAAFVCGHSQRSVLDTPIPRQAIYCGAALCERQRRSETGIFQRRRDRPNHSGSLQTSGAICNRP